MMKISAAILAILCFNYVSADSTIFFNTGVKLNAGQTNSADRLEQVLNDAGFDLKVNPLEKLAFAGERDQICAIYQQEKFNSKNIALRAFLRIACEVRYEALTQFTECIQGMEEALEPQCERACTRKFAISSIQGQCDALACTSNCVDAQLKECAAEAADESLNTLYSELLGAQIAWSWGLASVEEVQKTAETGPVSCKKLVNLSMNALESVEIMTKVSKNGFSK